ncbi:MAG TPA: adenosylcobinamide-GDP ribazoletransferase [Gammaproteobacteria bacterium]|nr:adenosylcobinamide-GDP ribazoletransferase [Gammaproteobacteria bacterium]
MKSFLLALQFLTRIPLRINVGDDPALAGRSLLWYPLVGGLMGVVLYGIAVLMANQSGLLTAAMILIIWVLITGGLHLDGLADSADAWAGGYGDKEKTLAIMKDPHVGSFAVVMLVLVLILKFAALGELVKSDNLIYLIIAPMLARSAAVFLFITTPYVRQNGLGSNMALHLPHTAAIIVLLLFVVPVIILQFIAVVAAILVLAGLRYLMLKRIGGMTGDTIGASIEIVEVVVLAGLVVF